MAFYPQLTLCRQVVVTESNTRRLREMIEWCDRTLGSSGNKWSVRGSRITFSKIKYFDWFVLVWMNSDYYDHIPVGNFRHRYSKELNED